MASPKLRHINYVGAWWIRESPTTLDASLKWLKVWCAAHLCSLLEPINHLRRCLAEVFALVCESISPPSTRSSLIRPLIRVIWVVRRRIVVCSHRRITFHFPLMNVRYCKQSISTRPVINRRHVFTSLMLFRSHPRPLIIAQFELIIAFGLKTEQS